MTARRRITGDAAANGGIRACPRCLLRLGALVGLWLAAVWVVLGRLRDRRRARA